MSANDLPAVCLHAHYYQPPREDPRTGEIPLQANAAPKHDWNERVFDECYLPNLSARVAAHDGERRLSTYAHTSFDFGPTLLAWIERAHPEAYRAILAGDRESRARFSGHGAALAQAYGHSILPLDVARDRRTQVVWGIRDFEHRFGRRPEGMWLPEAAVDLRTLETVAEQGIAFTVLAPTQAARVRDARDAPWREVTRAEANGAYLQRLPSGRSIALFFFDDGLAREIAFGDALVNGEALAARLVDRSRAAGLVHVAVDGETFGHHKKFGELGLAYALHTIASGQDARLTCYAEWLAAHPPTREVQIAERTSWSCAHGIERWRSDCGCRAGDPPGATQGWRGPLREAYEALRDALADPWERAAAVLLHDPWGARDDAIELTLTPTGPGARTFFARHARRQLDEAAERRVRALLELQRQLLFTMTSCAWFFDDPVDHATVQSVRHAFRAVELAREHLDIDPEPALRVALARVVSVDPVVGDARRIYDRIASSTPQGP